MRAALRVGAAIALLALAFRLAAPADGRSLPAALAGAWVSPPSLALAWFGLACACFGANFAAGALRFSLLLRGAGLAARGGAVLRAYVIAGFFNLVLPTGMLGDVYRFADARRDSGRGAESLGVLALERLLGLAALGSVALVAAPFLPPVAGGIRVAAPIVAVSAAAVAGCAAALHPAGNALLRRGARLLGRASERGGALAERALAAVASASARPARMAGAFALSLACQWIPVAAVLALSAPLDAALAWPWYAVIVPSVTLMSLVPVTVGGVGVRESLYVALFGAVGMRAEVALALSLSVFAVSLVWGLAGWLLFALGRRGRGDAALKGGGAA